VSFWAEWATVAFVGLLAVASPGPNQAMTIRNSLASRRAGVMTAVGVALGNAVHAFYCILGIAVVVAQSITLFSLLKYAGAAYLIYIGIKALRAPRHDGIGEAAPPESIGAAAALGSGLLTDLLNPKVTLFFLALFTQVIRPDTPVAAQVVYGATMVALELLWCAALALVIGHRSVRVRFERIAHWIERAMGGVLVALGLRLAFARASG
jgi:RhtB (resistance to homoserine/threonine) family protein